jgi:hypothetical protein
MPDNKNLRVHADILPALAAVVGPTTKILAIGSVTAKGTPEAIALSCLTKSAPRFAIISPARSSSGSSRRRATASSLSSTPKAPRRRTNSWRNFR